MVKISTSVQSINWHLTINVEELVKYNQMSSAYGFILWCCDFVLRPDMFLLCLIRNFFKWFYKEVAPSWNSGPSLSHTSTRVKTFDASDKQEIHLTPRPREEDSTTSVKRFCPKNNVCLVSHFMGCLTC